MRALCASVSLLDSLFVIGCTQTTPNAASMSGVSAGSAAPGMQQKATAVGGSSANASAGMATISGGSGGRPDATYSGRGGNAGSGSMVTLGGGSGGRPDASYAGVGAPSTTAPASR